MRSRLIDRLTSEGSADLVPLVDTNLFGMSVDPRLSAADQADLTTLIDLGQPMAVFIAPPPSDDDPNAAVMDLRERTSGRVAPATVATRGSWHGRGSSAG